MTFVTPGQGVGPTKIMSILVKLTKERTPVLRPLTSNDLQLALNFTWSVEYGPTLCLQNFSKIRNKKFPQKKSLFVVAFKTSDERSPFENLLPF